MEHFSVSIIGAGVAGLSAAVALADMGVNVCVLEADREIGGGLCHNAHPILSLMGWRGKTGRELAEKFIGDVVGDDRIRIAKQVDVQVLEHRPERQSLAFNTPDGARALTAHSVILALGTHPRSTHPIQEMAARSNRVVIGAAGLPEMAVEGKRVAIWGGGDNALENALLLANAGAEVDVFARNKIIGRQDFRESCESHPAIRVKERAAQNIMNVGPDFVELKTESGQHRYDFLIVLFGYAPSTAILSRRIVGGILEMDEHGYIRVDRWQHTNLENVYAVGDVTNSQPPSVATAMAQGVVAAKAIQRKIEGYLP